MLLVATHNSHKTEEIRVILCDFFDHITDLTTQGDHPAPEEDGDTFEANARIKALAASRRFPSAVVLADDSGLEVDALNDFPGVQSARYAGVGATDRDNRLKLLKALEGVTGRAARFRCVIVLAKAGEVLATFDGSCEGHIAEEQTGQSGFGYDTLFVPEGYYESFGLLCGEIKNTISHRARALEKLKAWLETTDPIL
jgi:XTP/dITP diphosphohydrolase